MSLRSWRMTSLGTGRSAVGGLLGVGTWAGVLAVTLAGCGDIVVASATDTGAGGVLDGGTTDGATTDGGAGQLDAGCTSNAACDDGDPCTQDVCGIDGRCAHPAAPDGTLCTDGDPQTVNDACAAGVCVGTAVDCTDLDAACARGAFDADAGKCVAEPKADGTACDDGDATTTGDVCTGGVCAGTAPDCSGLDGPCATGVYDAAQGQCVAQPKDEGQQCATACGPGTCTDGACEADPETCDDGDPCTEDSCDPAVGVCVHHPMPDCGGWECGDGFCALEWGENAALCPEDCGGSQCGDGFCALEWGENAALCPGDCMACEGGGGWCETDCSDGMDNNGDGLPDCDDPSCSIAPVCQQASPCATDADCPAPGDPCVVAACVDGQCIFQPAATGDGDLVVGAQIPPADGSPLGFIDPPPTAFWTTMPGPGAALAAIAYTGAPPMALSSELPWVTGNDALGYVTSEQASPGLEWMELTADGAVSRSPLVTGPFADWPRANVSRPYDDGLFAFAVRATSPEEPLEIGGTLVDTNGAVPDGGALWVVATAQPAADGGLSVVPALSIERVQSSSSQTSWVDLDQVKRGLSSSDDPVSREFFGSLWADGAFSLSALLPDGSSMPIGSFGGPDDPASPPPGGVRYVLYAALSYEGPNGSPGVAVWPAYWPASSGAMTHLVPLPSQGGFVRFALVFPLGIEPGVTVPGLGTGLVPRNPDDVAVVLYQGGFVQRAVAWESPWGSPGGVFVEDAVSDGEALLVTGHLPGTLYDLVAGQDLAPPLSASTVAVALDVSAQALAGGEPLALLGSMDMEMATSESSWHASVADARPGRGFVFALSASDISAQASGVYWSSEETGQTGEPLLFSNVTSAPPAETLWLVGLEPGAASADWIAPVTDGGVLPQLTSLTWAADGRFILGGSFDNVVGGLQLRGAQPLPAVWVQDVPWVPPSFSLEVPLMPPAEVLFAAGVNSGESLTCSAAGGP